MFVALEARTPCLLCACQVRILAFGSARVNKRSLRVSGPLLITLDHHCPECWTSTQGSSVPRSAYRLCPEDEAKVIAYRQRKWGVSDGTGPLVEARGRAA